VHTRYLPLASGNLSLTLIHSAILRTAFLTNLQNLPNGNPTVEMTARLSNLLAFHAIFVVNALEFQPIRYGFGQIFLVAIITAATIRSVHYGFGYDFVYKFYLFSH
jgi:hypothetical protein